MTMLEKLFRADRVEWQALTRGIESLAAAVEDPRFAPALHRWLRAERWNDQYPDRQARDGPPQRKTFGQIARESAAEAAGQSHDPPSHLDTDNHDGPTLDFVGGGSGADHFDLQPADPGRFRL